MKQSTTILFCYLLLLGLTPSDKRIGNTKGFEKAKKVMVEDLENNGERYINQLVRMRGKIENIARDLRFGVQCVEAVDEKEDAIELVVDESIVDDTRLIIDTQLKDLEVVFIIKVEENEGSSTLTFRLIGMIINPKNRGP